VRVEQQVESGVHRCHVPRDGDGLGAGGLRRAAVARQLSVGGGEKVTAVAANVHAGVQCPRQRDTDVPGDGRRFVRELDGDGVERTSTTLRRTDQVTRCHRRDNETVSHSRVINSFFVQSSITGTVTG